MEGEERIKVVKKEKGKNHPTVDQEESSRRQKSQEYEKLKRGQKRKGTKISFW